MGNLRKRIEKLELKTGNANLEKEPLEIHIIHFGDGYECLGRNEQIRQAETEGRFSLNNGQKQFVIQVNEGCGKECTRCGRARNV